jgi:hypothetical protein
MGTFLEIRAAIMANLGSQARILNGASGPEITLMSIWAAIYALFFEKDFETNAIEISALMALVIYKESLDVQMFLFNNNITMEVIPREGGGYSLVRVRFPTFKMDIGRICNDKNIFVLLYSDNDSNEDNYLYTTYNIYDGN